MSNAVRRVISKIIDYFRKMLIDEIRSTDSYYQQFGVASLMNR